MARNYWFLFFLATSGTVLHASSFVANKYLFSHTMPFLAAHTEKKPLIIQCAISAAHAAKTFNDQIISGFTEPENGLLEIDGRYNLQDIIKSKKEISSDYITPFMKETGGGAWIDQPLYFSARGSLAMYGARLLSIIPIGERWRLGAEIPFLHVEARQEYRYPIEQSALRVSLPDKEQVRRFNRLTHKDLQLDVGDWVHDDFGDMSAFLGWAREWQRIWLLRSIRLSIDAVITLPTGAVRDDSNPASIPVGNDGHVGFSFKIDPSAQLKEDVYVGVPMTLFFQLPHTRNRRLPVAHELPVFSPLIDRVRVVPGFTWRIAPFIRVEHLVENIHFAAAYVYTDHKADTWQDVRPTQLVPSYLSRTRLQTTQSGLSLEKEEELLKNDIANRRLSTSWHNTYLSFDLQYVPTSSKYMPLLQVTYDYSLSGERVARTHQISAALRWKW